MIVMEQWMTNVGRSRGWLGCPRESARVLWQMRGSTRRLSGGGGPMKKSDSQEPGSTAGTGG